MANIALGIKANTQKALGEFKKLSRELDNKFLIQGLKLDVVKGAFSQITREFDRSLGTQGLRSSETTGQLQRSLALNLGVFKRFGSEAAEVVSKDVTKGLQDLRAEGKLTQEVFKQSLNLGQFLDFDASGKELSNKLQSATKDIAGFIQQTSDLFGGSEGQLIQRALTGQITMDQYFQLTTGQGGATNKFREVFRKYQSALASNDPISRTEASLKAITEIQNDPQYQKTTRQILPIGSVLREIGGLFSETGLFGALRPLGEQIENFDGEVVDRNILQLTGKLLRTIFDRDRGVFAKLNRSLQEVFGAFDYLEPIAKGAEFLTSIFERLGNFFESQEFKNLLNIFKPLADSVRNIFQKGLSVDSINQLTTSLFEGIRGFFGKAADFIANSDTSVISSVLGKVIEEVGKTVPSFINLVFQALGKAIPTAIDTALKGGILGKILLGAAGIKGIGLLDRILGGGGVRTGVGNNLRDLQRRRINPRTGEVERRGFFEGGFIDRRVADRNRGREEAIRASIRKRELERQRANRRRIFPITGDYEDPSPPGGRPPGGRPPGGRPPGGRPPGGGGLGLRNLRDNVARSGKLFIRGIGDLTKQVKNAGNQYRSQIGPLPMGSSDPWAEVGPGRFSPRLTQYDDYTDRQNLADRFRGRYGRRLPLGTRPLRSLRRGGGGIAGVAAGILGLGLFSSGGSAQAREIENNEFLSREEKDDYLKQNTSLTRQGIGRGVITGAGGAFGGLVGAMFGPLGALIGAQLGSMAGEIVSDVLSPPVLEGIGKFAEDIGNWFKETAIKSFEFIKNPIGGLKDLVKGLTRGRFLGGVGTGLTVVGENGPELANLGSGSLVVPNSSIRGKLSSLTGGVNSIGSNSSPIINVEINVNAPGADQFASQLTDQVIVALNRQMSMEYN